MPDNWTVSRNNDGNNYEVRVYSALREAGAAGRWMTNLEIADAAGIAERTARKHTMRLTKIGILEQLTTYPSHQFKLCNASLLPEGSDGRVAWSELEAAARLEAGGHQP